MLLARRGELLWWVLANAAARAAEAFITEVIEHDIFSTFRRTGNFDDAVRQWPDLTVWLIAGAMIAVPQWLAVCRYGWTLRLWWIPATVAGYMAAMELSSPRDANRLLDALQGPLRGAADVTGSGVLWWGALALLGARGGALMGGAQALCLPLRRRSSLPRVARRWLAWTGACAAGGALASTLIRWVRLSWWEMADPNAAGNRPWWEIAHEVGIPGWAAALADLTYRLPESAGYTAIGALSGLVYGVVTATALGALQLDRVEESRADADRP